MSRLQQQKRNWAIVRRAQLNLDSVRANLIKNGFAIEYLSPSILAAALKYKNKDYLDALTKSAGII